LGWGKKERKKENLLYIMENFQIRPEQALAAFEAKMETDELAAYQHEMEQTILQPQKDFRCVSLSTVARHCPKLTVTKIGFWIDSAILYLHFHAEFHAPVL
jgi:hypothetical protein